MYATSMRSVMDSEPWIVTTSLAVLLVTLVALVALYSALERKKLPPGPMAWPVVGSFPAIAGALPHHAMRALAAKYGGLMYLRLGSVPALVVSSAAVNEELFRLHDANLLDRPRPLPMGFGVITDGGNNLTMANGPYWRQLRKICISELFTVRRQASYERMRTDEIRTRVREIVVAAEQGKPIDVKNWLLRVAANNMTRMTTNRRFFGDGTESEKDREDYESAMNRVHESLGLFLISDFVPYLGFITRLQGWEKSFNHLRTLISDVTQRVFDIEKHRQRAKERRADDESYVPDFVDLLLQTPFKDSETLPDRKIDLVLVSPNLNLGSVHEKLTFSRDPDQDMLSAGTDTIATALEWAMAELILQPQLMARLHAELDAVVGTTRLVQESDLPNLPFLQAVVKESYRLHPPLTLNVPRETTQAFTFRGYKMPKQTRLILNFHAIHRDPAVYEDPDAFRPDRFVDRPQVDQLSGFDSYELTPFSVGRRMCPASNLGNMMVTSILAHLMHSSEWRMPDGEAAIDMTEQFGLTTSMKSPLRLVATPRAPAVLY